jgi:excisionase family DNA binding protein
MSTALAPPRFLNTSAAAEYIGIKEQTLNNWRATKRQIIPFTRIGKLVRYRVEDLDAWLASRTEGAEALATSH